jgi:DNA invertase Pin-like site-specific DNA recombinase
MAMIGYARVSSENQSHDTQVERLKAAGCSVVRAEKVSGKSRDGRDELATVMDFIQAKDQLCVVRLCRLGRSTRDVLNLVHELDQKGASVRVLEPEIDTAGPMGKVVLTVLGMVAEMELSFLKNRQKVGIERARKNGVYKGRPVSLDHAKVVEMRQAGLGATEIAKAMGCSRGAVYKIIGQTNASKPKKSA